jgi:hypothetical protein
MKRNMKIASIVGACIGGAAIIAIPLIVVLTNKHQKKIGAYQLEGGALRAAAEEGIVLLKNDMVDNKPILPLIDSVKINVFGTTQFNYFYGG